MFIRASWKRKSTVVKCEIKLSNVQNDQFLCNLCYKEKFKPHFQGRGLQIDSAPLSQSPCGGHKKKGSVCIRSVFLHYNRSFKSIQECSIKLRGVKKANLPFMETPEACWVGKSTVLIMTSQRFPHGVELPSPSQDLHRQVRIELELGATMVDVAFLQGCSEYGLLLGIS